MMEVKLPDAWHNLLHRLWSKAVGTPDYVKSEWIELERILFHAATHAVEKRKAAGVGG